MEKSIMKESVEDMHEFLLRMVEDSAAHARTHFRTTTAFSEKIPRQLVTEADTDIETRIREKIAQRFPDHGIVGEEFDAKKTNAEYVWMIDPIDGTTNFIHKIPFFNTAVGLMKDGKFVLGAVAFPMLEMTFHAMRGQGAYLNDKPIDLATVRPLEKSFIAFCHGSDPENTKRITEAYPTFKQATLDFRKLGSAALEVCYVAAGFICGFVAYKIKPHDFKPACFIAQEAGCIVTDLAGNDWQAPGVDSVIVARGESLHAELLEKARQTSLIQ